MPGTGGDFTLVQSHAWMHCAKPFLLWKLLPDSCSFLNTLFIPKLPHNVKQVTQDLDPKMEGDRVGLGPVEEAELPLEKNANLIMGVCPILIVNPKQPALMHHARQTAAVLFRKEVWRDSTCQNLTSIATLYENLKEGLQPSIGVTGFE